VAVGQLLGCTKVGPTPTNTSTLPPGVRPDTSTLKLGTPGLLGLEGDSIANEKYWNVV